MTAPGLRARLVVVAGLSLAVGVAGCSSGGGDAGVATATTSPSPSTTSVAPPTTAQGQVPTVADCGGGAYKPTTLLIVCGVAGTMATGVRWQSWSRSGATGTGTVHIRVAGQPNQASADLRLSDPVTGPVGPQFSRLTVTWVGSSPDGHAQDTFHLAPG